MDATAAYLRERRLNLSLLVNPAVRGVFADLVDPIPNTVVLGDAGELFDYPHLNRAFRLLMQGAPLIVMGANRYFSDSIGELCLDIGPFKAALEYAADTEATVIGKPSAHLSYGLFSPCPAAIRSGHDRGRCRERYRRGSQCRPAGPAWSEPANTSSVMNSCVLTPQWLRI